MRCIKIYLFIFIGLFLLSTCKKFPEDSFLSIDTVKGRLKGTWKIESIKLKGVDYTLWDSLNIGFDQLNVNFSFDRVSGHDKVNDIIFSEDCSQCSSLGMLYFLVDLSRFSYKKKSTILFRLNGGSTVLTRMFSQSMLIRKLYRKKLILKNDIYEIHFNKISDK